MGEPLGRFGFLGHVLVHAAAGVDRQRQIQRQLRLTFEDCNLLLPAILGDGKILARQPADNRPRSGQSRSQRR